MPRKKKAPEPTPEQPIEEVPKEHKPRPLNPVWELAVIVTDEMHPHELLRQQVHMMNLTQLNKLKAHYDMLDVVDCWRNLKSDDSVAGFKVDDAKLITVIKGSPPYIERWIEAQLELPPVYKSYLYDLAVQQRADFLRRHGFRYGATDEPNRLPYERVSELGLL